MKIDLVLKDVDLNPVAEERVSRRLEKIAQLAQGVDAAQPRPHVTLEAARLEYDAHVRMTVAGREILGTGRSSENAVAAFDLAAAKIERQVCRRSRRLQRTDRGLRGSVEEARMDRAWTRW